MRNNEMDSSQMAQVASKYGFTHTPGNGNDFFSHGDILVVRDGLVYDIMVMGVHKSSIRSGLANALLTASYYIPYR